MTSTSKGFSEYVHLGSTWRRTARSVLLENSFRLDIVLQQENCLLPR